MFLSLIYYHITYMAVNSRYSVFAVDLPSYCLRIQAGGADTFIVI